MIHLVQGKDLQKSTVFRMKMETKYYFCTAKNEPNYV